MLNDWLNPDTEELILDLGKVVAAVMTIIGFGTLLRKWWTAWRVNHPPFKAEVRDALKALRDGQTRFDDYNAALLRDRLESSYTIYVKMMGWCPVTVKRTLMDLFALYQERGWNHINKRYCEDIMELPERPEDIEKEERT